MRNARKTKLREKNASGQRGKRSRAPSSTKSPRASKFPSTDVSLSPRPYNSTSSHWLTELTAGGRYVVRAYCHFARPIGKKGRCRNGRQKRGNKKKKAKKRDCRSESKQTAKEVNASVQPCVRARARALDSKMTPLTRLRVVVAVPTRTRARRCRAAPSFHCNYGKLPP